MWIKKKNFRKTFIYILSLTASKNLNCRWSIVGKHRGLTFQSSYECRFIEICNHLNIKLESGSKYRVRYQWYYPDFYIPDLNLIVEIKGYLSNVDFMKMIFFIKNNKNIRYKILFDKHLKWLCKRYSISYDIEKYDGVNIYAKNKISWKDKTK